MEELKQDFYEVMYKYEQAFGETGVMANLTRILADLKVNIRSLSSREEESGVSIISMSIEVHSLDHLNFIASKIRKDENVLDIHRANQ